MAIIKFPGVSAVAIRIATCNFTGIGKSANEAF